MPNPRQPFYRVRRGDTLSGIALAEYGDATLWPEIAKVNGIPNGNVILIGMRLTLLPIASKTAGAHVAHSAGPIATPRTPMVGPPRPVAALPAVQRAGLAELPVARAVICPAVKYKLDDIPPLVVSTPQADYKVKLVGEMAIQQKGTLSEIEFSRSGAISQKLKTEYDSKLVRLANQVKVKWDFSSLTAEVSCGFTVATKINGKEFVSHQYDYIPPNRFKYTLKPKEVAGEVDDVVFKGSLGYELEVTAKTSPGSAARLPAPSQNRQMVWVTIGGLVVIGAVIIVADLAKDVATLGAGAAESPLSFSAAMALFARAAQLAH